MVQIWGQSEATQFFANLVVKFPAGTFFPGRKTASFLESTTSETFLVDSVDFLVSVVFVTARNSEVFAKRKMIVVILVYRQPVVFCRRLLGLREHRN